jgi:2-haloacid dehalogenase
MLVAAHHDDLAGARACGLRTAYIERRWNLARATQRMWRRARATDLHCSSIGQLADVLGC